MKINNNKYSSRKFILCTVSALGILYKILFMTAAAEWGYVLIGILGVYCGGNVLKEKYRASKK